MSARFADALVYVMWGGSQSALSFMFVTHSMAFMVDFIHSVTGQQQQPMCWLRHVRSQITIAETWFVVFCGISDISRRLWTSIVFPLFLMSREGA